MNGNGNSYDFSSQNGCHLGILVHNTYQIGFINGVLSNLIGYSSQNLEIKIKVEEKEHT